MLVAGLVVQLPATALAAETGIAQDFTFAGCDTIGMAGNGIEVVDFVKFVEVQITLGADTGSSTRSPPAPRRKYAVHRTTIGVAWLGVLQGRAYSATMAVLGDDLTGTVLFAAATTL